MAKYRTGSKIRMLTDVNGRWDIAGKVKVDLTVGEEYVVHSVVGAHCVILYPITNGEVLIQLLKGEFESV